MVSIYYFFKIILYFFIIVIFDCTVEENDKKERYIKSLNTKSNYELILTEDCFLLLEKLDSGNGKIVFWSSLFSITDLQLNKSKKITTINFYDEDTNSEYQIKLRVDNILLFRDSLVKKMRSLKVKVNSQKLIKGQTLNRLSEKEIRSMKINDKEKNTKALKERIFKGAEEILYDTTTLPETVAIYDKDNYQETFTGKIIEIESNTFYNELIESREIVETKPDETKEITIPNVEAIRDRINTLVEDIRIVEYNNHFGDECWERTFSTSKLLDKDYVQLVFEGLDSAIKKHFLESSIKATEVLEYDNRIENGNIEIPIKALEELKKLYDEIKTRYPKYLDPLFEATAKILNSNYIEPKQLAWEDDLPF